MSGASPTENETDFGPEAYSRWRASELGSITAILEDRSLTARSSAFMQARTLLRKSWVMFASFAGTST